MKMLSWIIVATTFNAVFHTNCYELPAWNNLVVLKKAVPHDAELLPFKRMAPTPFSRYEIQPGSHGIFADIALNIQARMKGIAKGPYVVVFDYGGIAPKYFSIIEDMATGSGVKVGSLGTVMVEPPGITRNVESPGSAIKRVDEIMPVGGQRHMEPVLEKNIGFSAVTVPAIAAPAGIVMKTPVSIPEDAQSIHNGVTLSGMEINPSLTTLPTAGIVKFMSTTNTPLSMLNADASSGSAIRNGIPMVNNPASTFNTAALPSNTEGTLEPTNAIQNIPSAGHGIAPTVTNPASTLTTAALTSNTELTLESTNAIENIPSTGHGIASTGTNPDSTLTTAALPSNIEGTLEFTNPTENIPSTGHGTDSTLTNPASTLTTAALPSNIEGTPESTNAIENIPSIGHEIASTGTDPTSTLNPAALPSNIQETLESTNAIENIPSTGHGIASTRTNPANTLNTASLPSNIEGKLESTNAIEKIPSTGHANASTGTNPDSTLNIAALPSNIEGTPESTNVRENIPSPGHGIASLVTNPTTTSKTAVLPSSIDVTLESTNNATENIPSTGHGTGSTETYPASTLKTAALPSNTEVTLESYYSKETTPLTTDTLVPVESERSLYKEPIVVDSSVAEDERTPDKAPSSIELGISHSLVSGVTPSIVSTGSTFVMEGITANSPSLSKTIPSSSAAARGLVVTIEGELSIANKSSANEASDVLNTTDAIPSTTALPLVSSSVGTVMETPAIVLRDGTLLNDEVTTTPNGNEAKLSSAMVITANTAIPAEATVMSTPISIPKEKTTSKDNAIASEVELIMPKTASMLNTLNSPSSTVMPLESVGTEETASLSASTVIFTEDEQQSTEPTAADSAVIAMDGASGKAPLGIGLGKSNLKDTDDVPTATTAYKVGEINAPAITNNPTSTLKTMYSLSRAAPKHESLDGGNKIPSNTVMTVESEPSLSNYSSANTVETVVESPVSVPKDGPSKDENVTSAETVDAESLQKITAKPSTAVSTEETIKNATIVPLNDRGSIVDTSLNTHVTTLKEVPSTNDGVTYTRIVTYSDVPKSIEEETSTPETGNRHDSTVVPVLDNPLTTLNETKPSTGTTSSSIETTVETLANILKEKSPMEAEINELDGVTIMDTLDSKVNDGDSTFMVNPHSHLKVVASPTGIEEALELVNSEERTPVTTNRVEPIVSERPPRNEPIAEESSVSAKLVVEDVPPIVSQIPPQNEPITRESSELAKPTISNVPGRKIAPKEPVGDLASSGKLILPNHANALNNSSLPSSPAVAMDLINAALNTPSTANLQVSVEGEQPLTSGQNSGLSNLKRVEGIPSAITLPSSNLNMLLGIPKDYKTKDEVPFILKNIAGNAHTEQPIASTQESTVETQMNISNGDATNDVVTLSMKRIEVNHSTIPPQTPITEITENNTQADILYGESSTSSGIASNNPLTALNTIPSASTNAVPLESVNEEEVTPHTVFPIEGGRALPNAPTAINISVESMNTGSVTDPSGEGLSKSLLQGITDGVATSIAATGSGIASMVKMLMTSPTNLKDSSTPSSKTLESVNDESNISLINSTVPIERDQSLPDKSKSNDSLRKTEEVASDTAVSGVVSNELNNMEAEPLLVAGMISKLMTITARPISRSTTSSTVMETQASIPNADLPINDGATPKNVEANPSTATEPAVASNVVKTAANVLGDTSPATDGNGSLVKSIVEKPSTPEEQTTKKETVLNAPVSILRYGDSSPDGGIAPITKLSAKNPNGSTTTIISSTTAASLETAHAHFPIESARSLPNELSSQTSSVKTADPSTDKGPSGELSKSLFRGITDGVATSIASAGSGIASIMKFIIPVPADPWNDVAPSTTAKTLDFGIKPNFEKSERSLLSESPTEAGDWASGKDPSGMGLSKYLLKIISASVKNGLAGVKAIELPGKTSIALLFPDHHVSIADKETNEIMNFTPQENETVNAADAQGLYTGLKPVTTEVSFIIKSRGFNCVPLRLTKLDLNLYVVDSIIFGEGNICGLENMQPSNMVTITKDDKDNMEVTMPLVLRNLTVKIDSIDVRNYFFSIIKGQPIEASVREISCKGTFSFKKGAQFELTSFRMEWGDINGVHIKLEGALEEGSSVSGLIDSIASALTGVIKSFISPILDEIEKQITKSILGS